MFDFIKNMWVMGRIDQAKVQTYAKDYITQEEADMILATPQIKGE